MRETVRSLRIYLGICGALGILTSGAQVVSPRVPLWLSALFLLGAAASAALLYLAIRLPHVLQYDLERGLLIVHANLAYSAIWLVLVLAIVGPGMTFGQLVFGVVILLYIRQNLRRLSAEAICGAASAALAEESTPV